MADEENTRSQSSMWPGSLMLVAETEVISQRHQTNSARVFFEKKPGRTCNFKTLGKAPESKRCFIRVSYTDSRSLIIPVGYRFPKHFKATKGISILPCVRLPLNEMLATLRVPSYTPAWRERLFAVGGGTPLYGLYNPLSKLLSLREFIARRSFPARDHLRYNLGMISGPGIICGLVLGSLADPGLFSGRDQLRASFNIVEKGGGVVQHRLR